MKRIKRVFLLTHIICWILFNLLVALQLSQDTSFNWLTVTVGVLLTSLYVFYSHFFLALPHFTSHFTGTHFLPLVISARLPSTVSL